MHAHRRICAVIAMLLWPVSAAALDGPRPPCGTPPAPAYRDPPAIGMWTPGELSSTWKPPACTGWSGEDFKVLAALAGRFRYDGGIEDLLARFGAVSRLAGLRYWSVSAKAWRTLISEAHALEAPQGDRGRRDFSASEIRSGGDLFFAQQDAGASGEVVYRMRVREATPDRAIIAIENASTIRMLLFPLFDPGSLQFVYVLERLAPGSWGFYGLARAGGSASVLSEGHEASYVNRLAAVYRYVAGIPADAAPPAAP